MGLAIELGQRNVRAIVVERYQKPQPIPKGQNLTQRTMEHFHFWGAERQLRAARTIPKDYGIGGLTAYGTLLGGHTHDWMQRELVRPYYFTDNERLPQYATEAVLRERAGALPSIELLAGWSADRVVQDDNGVTVGISERGGDRPDDASQRLCGRVRRKPLAGARADGHHADVVGSRPADGAARFPVPPIAPAAGAISRTSPSTTCCIPT